MHSFTRGFSPDQLSTCSALRENLHTTTTEHSASHRLKLTLINYASLSRAFYKGWIVSVVVIYISFKFQVPRMKDVNHSTMKNKKKQTPRLSPFLTFSVHFKCCNMHQIQGVKLTSLPRAAHRHCPFAKQVTCMLYFPPVHFFSVIVLLCATPPPPFTA